MDQTATGSPAPALTENARRIFDLRYARRDEHGRLENPVDAIRRVATNVAAVTALYEVDDPGGSRQSEEVDVDGYPWRTALRQFTYLHPRRNGTSFADTVGAGKLAAQERAQRYIRLLSDLEFLPNSPTWTGAGTDLGQLAACFVLPVEDDLGRSRQSIFETLKVAALIQQTGGGNGFSFSRLRPRSAIVSRSKGEASGPIGFLAAYDAAFGVIAQGGTRRGANMGVLRVDHPDIRAFVAAKLTEGALPNFNISVAITDAFMEAVNAGKPLSLTHEGRIYDTVDARSLFEEIVHAAWSLGDPGSLFVDRANRDNPCPARYQLEATNPCGEQWLGPYENCCLGSIPLGPFVDDDGAFDWERLGRTVELATQFLDDVIDANQYVPEVPELEAAAQGARRVGLGIMGLADAMIKMGIRYGSARSLDFASQLGEFVRYHSMQASIERARTRGPFEWIHGSIYDPELLRARGPAAHVGDITLWAPPTPLVPHTHDFARPTCDWASLTESLCRHGIRNACVLTIAPTGTIANVAGAEGSGCEPLFALAYHRSVRSTDDQLSLRYRSPLFESALRRAGLSQDELDAALAEVAADGGSCQRAARVPDRLREVFVVAADLGAEQHVWMQAVLQRFVDNSISKTINLPAQATPDDVAAAYTLAHQLGCKGITVYRQGSRNVEVLTAGDLDAGSDGARRTSDTGRWPVNHPLPLPEYVENEGLPTRTFKVRTPFGSMHVYITELIEHPGRPFDVRLQIGKAGNDKAADVEAIGRMASLALRTGVPVDEVIEQLEGIGGAASHGFGGTRVRSAADGLAKLLRGRYRAQEHETGIHAPRRLEPPHRPAGPELADRTTAALDLLTVCPQCRNTTIVIEGGCRHCDVRLGGCGSYSACD